MTKKLLNSEWIARLADCSKLVVGFSGGLDSTVLLHFLADHPSLRHKIVAVHINHGISVNADSWQHHCAQFCLDLGIEFIAQTVEFNRNSNLEAEARSARYKVFSSLLKTEDCLILAHHLNDQAETLLLQLFRGAGVDGLAAMNESSYLGFNLVLRPFLTTTRTQLEHYAAIHQLSWIEDESNQDLYYSRNFLRHKVIPLLEEQWPGVVKSIARTAIHCQQAKENLDELALIDCPQLVTPTSVLSFEPLKMLSPERLTNVLRLWLKKNNLQMPSSLTLQRLIPELIEAKPDAKSIVAWGAVEVRRYQHTLYLVSKQIKIDSSPVDWLDFPKPLVINNLKLTASPSKEGVTIPQQALIQLKFRQGGELFNWHGQTKLLKKLFQEWEIPPWMRDKIPLLYINNKLAAVIGYAISDAYYCSIEEQSAWEITANPISLNNPNDSPSM